MLRSDFVWFGETLPESAWLQAMRIFVAEELMLVVGTSAMLHPLASRTSEARRHG